MFRNYLKTAWRNLVKRKFYSVINILGLSLGIACALFLYLFISFHFSFDRYHKNAATTYKIVNDIYFEKTAYINGASMGMYNALASDNADIRNANVMISNYSLTTEIKVKNKEQKFFKEDNDIAIVSPGWFKMFDYKFIEGSAAGLARPNTAVITQRLANKYFGIDDPIGKVIFFPNNVPVKIIGLISNKPYNSDLRSGMYVSLLSFKNIFPNVGNKFFTDWSWISTNTSVFLTLNNTQSKTVVEAEMNKLAKAHLGNNAKYYHFSLLPVTELHFENNYGGAIQKSLLFTLMIIGICILVIASINYVNLSIAQQTTRMVEIGARKVFGATPWDLFIQFITETFLTVLSAVIIAAMIVEATFPVVNRLFFTRSPVYILSYKNIIIFLSIILVALVMLAGFYPAAVLSRVRVLKAVKNITGSWKAGLLRKGLVVMQNAVACVLIICTIVMLMQVLYLKHTQIGFNANAVVMLPLPNTANAQKDLIRSRFSTIPQIASYSFCHSAPSSQNDWSGSVKFGNRPDWEPWQGRSEVGDSAYVNTFELQIIAGRNIREPSASPEFLINEKMAHKLGFKDLQDVVGKKLVVGEFGDQHGTIVGVVKDFNTQSLLVPIEPVVIADEPGKSNSIAVKLKGNDLKSTIANIRKTWQQAFPNNVFEYHFTDDQIADLYMQQDIQQKLIWLAAIIAIIISCLGLLGLVSLVILQRTKEIGIRKVLGASVAGIVQMISNDFLKLVAIAILIAVPVAGWIMHDWLRNFAYHITISWWVFASGALLVICIALCTICFQSARAAMANPVDALRSE